jgi:hypothetical protein
MTMAQIGMRPLLIVGVVSGERRRVSPRPRIFNLSFGSLQKISFWDDSELPKFGSCGVLRPLFTVTDANGKVLLYRKAKHLPRMTLLFLLYSVVVVVAWVAFFHL